MTHPIPDAALDDRLAFVGTAGAGKTYAAMTAVERLLDRKARVVIPDALGVWYGLRLKPNGIDAAYEDVVVFGGPHGDMQITEHAGALIGETIAGIRESCIVDLSTLGTKAAERRFMLAMLTSLYRQTIGDPVHLIFDEADMWAPQKLLDRDGDAARLLGQMETIVRRGRVKGFIPWLITQRPAVLSKDVLSQADGLIAMKLTASQDRNAIGAWIEGQADVQEGKAILASLPTMARGQGVIWIPSRGILSTEQFPVKATFDSSRTPKRGEAKRDVKLTPINIEAVRGKLATVENQAMENDPKRLKQIIADLQKKTAVPAKVETVNDPAALKAEYVRGHADGVRVTAGFLLGQVREFVGVFERAAAASMPIDYKSDVKPNGLAKLVIAAPPRPAAPSVPKAGDGSQLGAERRPLAVLVGVYPGGYSEAQWAAIAGFKRTGGTWGTYKSRLRAAGRIEERGNLFYATEQAVTELGSSVETPPSPGPDLVAYWQGKIGAEKKMLTPLWERYPDTMTRDDLGAAVDMTPSGGSFGTYLSRLRSCGLIEEAAGAIRLHPNIGG